MMRGCSFAKVLRITQALCTALISFTYLYRTFTDLIAVQPAKCRENAHSHCAGMRRHGGSGVRLRKGNI
jgi:hypothetical protein